MRQKFFTVLLVSLLTSSFFLTASSIDLKNKPFSLSYEDTAELPIWSIGDFWIYDMRFDFVLSGVVGIDGLDPDDPSKGITNMRVEVVDINTNKDEYTLDINGDIFCQLEIFGIGFGSYNADLEGIAHIEISTLAVKDFEFFATGIYQIVIPRKTDVTFGMTFTPYFNFFDFPINTTETPWNADTFGRLYGHIKVEGLYDNDFGTEGPFENETISYVKKEEITVPGGTFDTYLISGSMGPTHNGWSKLWYSSDVKYLVKVDEKIEDWEGVNAQLDLTLQATNCYTNAVVDITVHRIKMLDEIEVLPEWFGADWSYKLSIDDGDKWVHETNDDYSNDEDDHTEDVSYNFNVFITTPRITIKVWDRDFWSGDDLADVSSQVGGGIDDQTPDLECAIFKCKYDIIENKLKNNDTTIIEDSYFVTSGDFLPDGSVGDPPDENDAKVWFKITDNYEPPKKPNKPDGQTSGKPGIEYTFSTGVSSSKENQRFYKWDWGDSTYSEWIGPYNSDETVKGRHIWAIKGSYNIRVKVKDVLDVESDWSDPLTVTMPRVRQLDHKFLFSLLIKFHKLINLINNI